MQLIKITTIHFKTNNLLTQIWQRIHWAGSDLDRTGTRGYIMPMSVLTKMVQMCVFMCAGGQTNWTSSLLLPLRTLKDSWDIRWTPSSWWRDWTQSGGSWRAWCSPTCLTVKFVFLLQITAYIYSPYSQGSRVQGFTVCTTVTPSDLWPSSQTEKKHPKYPLTGKKWKKPEEGAEWTEQQNRFTFRMATLVRALRTRSLAFTFDLTLVILVLIVTNKHSE